MYRYKYPIINLFIKKNNTIISLRNISGNILFTYSSGSIGFKKGKRSSTYAAECTGFYIGKKAISLGIKYVQLSIRGIGTNKIASIRGLRGSGLRISRIKDNNRIAFGGCRLKKIRRI